MLIAKLMGHPINIWRIPTAHVKKGPTQKAVLIAFDGS